MRTIVLPSEPQSISDARHFLESVAAAWDLEPGHHPDVALAVSELVTNAVVHGAGPVEMALHLDGSCVRLDVTSEASESVPRILHRSPDALAGRGLKIVDAVSAEWGHLREGTRCTVWARFDVSPRPVP